MSHDDLSRYRAEFPITEQFAFLSHAAVSPLSRRVTSAVREQIAVAETTPPMRFFPELFATLGDLRQRLAALVNARGPDEIVLMPNTAAGINTAAVSLPLR